MSRHTMGIAKIDNDQMNSEVFENDRFRFASSSTALVAQLQQTKQGNLNIDEYVRSIESLMTDLTIAQAGDNGEAIATCREANEKIAIEVFTRGIRNREVQTVTRARNFRSLSEAINAAKKESVVDEQNSISLMQKWRNTGFQRNVSKASKVKDNFLRFNNISKLKQSVTVQIAALPNSSEGWNSKFPGYGR
ncbi:hypothetical protein FQA39_LY04970 [Lamprigera yunnana]|nr:hypothetical protein FQA39_LY04970 [Lamprigera yunnana]